MIGLMSESAPKKIESVETRLRSKYSAKTSDE